MRGLPTSGTESLSSALAGRFFTTESPEAPEYFIYLAALGLSCGIWDLVP